MSTCFRLKYSTKAIYKLYDVAMSKVLCQELFRLPERRHTPDINHDLRAKFFLLSELFL